VNDFIVGEQKSECAQATLILMGSLIALLRRLVDNDAFDRDSSTQLNVAASTMTQLAEKARETVFLEDSAHDFDQMVKANEIIWGQLMQSPRQALKVFRSLCSADDNVVPLREKPPSPSLSRERITAPQTGSTWQNRKSQDIYRVTGRRFDATNATEGRIMVSYVPLTGDRRHLQSVECDDYEREIGEFFVKFEPKFIR